MGVAGCSTVSDDDPERERLLARVEDLETEVAECEAQLASLRGLQHEAASLDPWPFVDEATHERMADVVVPLRASVVKILVDHPYYESGATPPATGWVYDDGLVVTNKHVADPRNIDGFELEAIETFDGDVRECELLESDPSIDGALLEASTDGLDPLPTGRSDDLEMDDPVVVLGHPKTVGTWVASLGAYRGEQGQRSFVAEGQSMLGMSGSPVIDEHGTVVGLHTASGVIEYLPDGMQSEFDESDFTFGEPVSRSSAVFERYPPRGYVRQLKIEPLVELFDEWLAA